MNHVELLNRSYLENELERIGLPGMVENLIERMKEYVLYVSNKVFFEHIVVEADMVVDGEVKHVRARFYVRECEDPVEDVEVNEEPTRFVEFESLDRTKE